MLSPKPKFTPLHNTEKTAEPVGSAKIGVIKIGKQTFMFAKCDLMAFETVPSTGDTVGYGNFYFKNGSVYGFTHIANQGELDSLVQQVGEQWTPE